MAGIGYKTEPDKNIPTKKSSGADWINWYDSLKSNFGRKKANELFLKTWRVRGSRDANTSDLRDHLEKKGGLKLESTTLNVLEDLGGDVADYFGDIFTAGKWIGIGLAAITALGVGMLLFNIAKAPGEFVGSAAKAYKGGK
jgi:hypothetical protein